MSARETSATLSLDSSERTDHLSLEVESDFRRFIEDPLFPCLGAKSAVRLETCTIKVYGSMASESGTGDLADDLARFGGEAADDVKGFKAFCAVFPKSTFPDEVEFERDLWRQLQMLHDIDSAAGAWAADTSSDPDDPHFSFSFAGQAFFVVGLHPASSRLARRFRWPALVFNPHAQFSRLRAEGRFDGLRAAIRTREIKLQGSLNPNLADFGEVSEARQYSGRKTDGDWKCPFHAKPT